MGTDLLPVFLFFAVISFLMLWIQALCEGSWFPDLSRGDKWMELLVCSLGFPLPFLIRDTARDLALFRARRAETLNGDRPEKETEDRNYIGPVN